LSFEVENNSTVVNGLKDEITDLTSQLQSARTSLEEKMRTVLNLNNKIEELQDTELELRKEIDTLNSQLDEIRVESNIFTKRSQNEIRDMK